MFKAAVSAFSINPMRYHGFLYRQASVFGFRFFPSVVTSIHYYSSVCVEPTVWTYRLIHLEKPSKNFAVLDHTVMAGSHHQWFSRSRAPSPFHHIALACYAVRQWEFSGVLEGRAKRFVQPPLEGRIFDV